MRRFSFIGDQLHNVEAVFYNEYKSKNENLSIHTIYEFDLMDIVRNNTSGYIDSGLHIFYQVSIIIYDSMKPC